MVIRPFNRLRNRSIIKYIQRTFAIAANHNIAKAFRSEQVEVFVFNSALSADALVYTMSVL